jgi:hypothetical protein
MSFTNAFVHCEPRQMRTVLPQYDRLGPATHKAASLHAPTPVHPHVTCPTGRLREYVEQERRNSHVPSYFNATFLVTAPSDSPVSSGSPSSGAAAHPELTTKTAAAIAATKASLCTGVLSTGAPSSAARFEQSPDHGRFQSEPRGSRAITPLMRRATGGARTGARGHAIQ